MGKEGEDHATDILEREAQEAGHQGTPIQEIDTLALVLEKEAMIENIEMTIEIDLERDLEKDTETQETAEI